MRTRISHTIQRRALTVTTLLLSLCQLAMARAEESAEGLNVPPERFTALFNGKSSSIPVEFRNIFITIMEFVAEHEKQ